MGTQIDFGEDDINRRSPRSKRSPIYTKAKQSPIKAKAVPNRLTNRQINQTEIIIKLKGDLALQNNNSNVVNNGNLEKLEIDARRQQGPTLQSEM